MDELNVVLEYRRSRPVWVCLECDTENDTGSTSCLFCGRNRSGNEWTIDAWKPSFTPINNGDVVVNSGAGGYGLNSEPNVSQPPYVSGYGSVSGPSAGWTPKTDPGKPSNSAAIVGLAVGAVALFIIALLVIIAASL